MLIEESHFCTIFVPVVHYKDVFLLDEFYNSRQYTNLEVALFAYTTVRMNRGVFRASHTSKIMECMSQCGM